MRDKTITLKQRLEGLFVFGAAARGNDRRNQTAGPRADAARAVERRGQEGRHSAPRAAAAVAAAARPRVGGALTFWSALAIISIIV